MDTLASVSVLSIHLLAEASEECKVGLESTEKKARRRVGELIIPEGSLARVRSRSVTGEERAE